MKNNIIGIIITIVGCLLIIIGVGLVFKNYISNSKDDEFHNNDNKDDDGKKEDNPSDNEEEFNCEYALQNVLFKTLTIEYNDKIIKFKFLNCIKEKNTSSKTNKKYQSNDGNYELNLTIVEETSESYYKKIKSEYEESKLKYDTNNKRVVTFNGVVFYTIKANEIDEDNNVKSQDYNIIYPIDKKNSINIKVAYKLGKIDDDFFTEVENSIAIMDKESKAPSIKKEDKESDTNKTIE